MPCPFYARVRSAQKVDESVVVEDDDNKDLLSRSRNKSSKVNNSEMFVHCERSAHTTNTYIMELE